MNLNQVTLLSEKPVETVEFFEKLGVRRIVDSLPRYARLECPDGDSTLSVNIAENVHANDSITLYFECDDLDERFVCSKRFGLAFQEDPTDRSWLLRQAYLKDQTATRSACSSQEKIVKIRLGE